MPIHIPFPFLNSSQPITFTTVPAALCIEEMSPQLVSVLANAGLVIKPWVQQSLAWASSQTLPTHGFFI